MDIPYYNNISHLDFFLRLCLLCGFMGFCLGRDTVKRQSNRCGKAPRIVRQKELKSWVRCGLCLEAIWIWNQIDSLSVLITLTISLQKVHLLTHCSKIINKKFEDSPIGKLCSENTLNCAAHDFFFV